MSILSFRGISGTYCSPDKFSVIIFTYDKIHIDKAWEEMDFTLLD